MAIVITGNSTQGDKVYKNQSATIRLNTNTTDLTSTETVKYLVEKPSGYTTEIGTTVYSTSNGSVTKTFSTGYFDQRGQWTLKTFISTRGYQTGENFYLFIYDRWER
jgi:hypothetical protein